MDGRQETGKYQSYIFVLHFAISQTEYYFRRCSFYGITIHYINDQWNLISTTLDVVASDGKHTGLDIANIFFEALENHDLVGKVIGITMDNASANSKFIEHLGN